MNRIFAALRSVAMVALAAGALPTQAFHSGGVAECNGCHTMHNSLEGVAADADMNQFESGPYLLKGNDQSSACLNCHSGPTLSSYHVATYPDVAAGVPPANMTPGGDFSWLKKIYTWSPRFGTTETSAGDRRGHNIIAADFGFAADATLTVAPGGTYPADQLACSSCHDPHGKYRRFADGTIVDGKVEPTLPISNSGSYFSSADPVANVYAVGVYRLLGGQGYQPKSLAGSFAFPNQVPAAVAPSSYNRSEVSSQTKIAYGTGMSEWCANCHTQIHENAYTSGQAGLTHPAGSNDKLDGFIVSNYNAYVKTGDLSGTVANAWNSLVPFEEGTADYTVLKGKATDLTGPGDGTTATENVMCLSCHRVHASAFTSMVRWSLDYEFLSNGDASGNPVYTTAAVQQLKSPAEITAAYYGRETTFSGYQRALCNKCHVKD